jgi:hypothetical protein
MSRSLYESHITLYLSFFFSHNNTSLSSTHKPKHLSLYPTQISNHSLNAILSSSNPHLRAELGKHSNLQFSHFRTNRQKCTRKVLARRSAFTAESRVATVAVVTTHPKALRQNTNTIGYGTVVIAECKVE